MDYEIQRCSRHCHATGRDLLPGETYYSVLQAEGAETKRYDFSVEAWQGPPAEAIGWWKSRIPDPQAERKHWAPNDVMLQLFDQLAQQPQQQDLRYVLALLLVRRRVMRLEQNEANLPGSSTMVLYCPRRDATYEIPVVVPEPSRIEQIQQELGRLLQ